MDHDYDLDIAGCTHVRSYREEAAIIFSALDCILNGEKGIYASSELTTGRRAYGLFDEHGVRNGHELREKIGEDPHRSLILAPNIEAAADFARRLRERFGGTELVITPAPFEAPGWTQAEYLNFWETLVRTRTKAVYFNEAWQYSNGCTFEFVVARDAGVPTFDAQGEPLDLERGIRQVARAVAELVSRGLAPTRLQAHLARLEEMRAPAGSS
ncbi:MAG TPA: hypothetical protein VHG28_22630 [Longimicrobiaceae bacterium]|nr:hypothetical protein [Longimicrobiaceae bacterium]